MAEVIVSSSVLDTQQLIEEITRVVYSQKKINRSVSDIKDTVSTFVKYINYFNTLDQYDKSCFNNVIPLDEIVILNEFKDLLYPASIKRIAGSYMCDELLIYFNKESLDNINDYSFSEYMQCINTLRSYTKRDAFTDYVKLSDIKLEVSLDSIINRVSYGGEVRVQNDWFYPIPVNTNNDYNNLYYNTEASICAINYFSLLKI